MKKFEFSAAIYAIGLITAGLYLTGCAPCRCDVKKPEMKAGDILQMKLTKELVIVLADQNSNANNCPYSNSRGQSILVRVSSGNEHCLWPFEVMPTEIPEVKVEKQVSNIKEVK